VVLAVLHAISECHAQVSEVFHAESPLRVAAAMEAVASSSDLHTVAAASHWLKSPGAHPTHDKLALCSRLEPLVEQAASPEALHLALTAATNAGCSSSCNQARTVSAIQDALSSPALPTVYHGALAASLCPDIEVGVVHS